MVLRGRTERHLHHARYPALIAALALLVAACGGSGTSSTSQTSGYGSSPSATAAGGGAATVTTKSGPAGAYLTDGDGKALYLWVADTGTTSTCTGPCATAWPPLATKGAPTSKADADASLLGTTTREDGSTQVTYAGHPLYYFVKDVDAEDTYGQGSDGFGAKWWLVAPTGSAITQ